MDRSAPSENRHPGAPPQRAPDGWRLRVWGQVEQEAEWSWEEFARLPAVERALEIRCAAGRRLDGSRWRGVATRELLSRIRLRPAAAFVLVHAQGGYISGLSLGSFASAGALFAWCLDGRPLIAQRGGPLRLIVPGRGAPKCVKWVSGLEFLNKPWPATPDFSPVSCSR